MSSSRQTLLSPLPASTVRERNYMQYDKYGCRKKSRKDSEMNTIVAFFD